MAQQVHSSRFTDIILNSVFFFHLVCLDCLDCRDADKDTTLQTHKAGLADKSLLLGSIKDAYREGKHSSEANQENSQGRRTQASTTQ